MGNDQSHRELGDAIAQVAQERERLRVGPVQVIGDQGQRPLLSQPTQNPEHAVSDCRRLRGCVIRLGDQSGGQNPGRRGGGAFKELLSPLSRQAPEGRLDQADDQRPGDGLEQLVGPGRENFEI